MDFESIVEGIRMASKDSIVERCKANAVKLKAMKQFAGLSREEICCMCLWLSRSSLDGCDCSLPSQINPGMDKPLEEPYKSLVDHILSGLRKMQPVAVSGIMVSNMQRASYTAGSTISWNRIDLAFTNKFEAEFQATEYGYGSYVDYGTILFVKGDCKVYDTTLFGDKKAYLIMPGTKFVVNGPVSHRDFAAYEVTQA